MLGSQYQAVPQYSDKRNRMLVTNYRQGDERSLRTLIKENKKLVYKQAQYYSKSCVPVKIQHDWMVNAGVLGLAHAAQKFNLSKKVKFSTYATAVIRNEMRDEFCRLTGFTRTHFERIRKAEKVREKSRLVLGRELTLSEVASELKVTLTQLQGSMDKWKIVSCYSLDKTINESTDDWISAIPSKDYGSGEPILFNPKLEELYEDGSLTEIELNILQLKVDGLKYKDIKTRLNLSSDDFDSCLSHAKKVLAKSLNFNQSKVREKSIKALQSRPWSMRSTA